MMMTTWLWFSGVRLYVNSRDTVHSFPAVSGKPSGGQGPSGELNSLLFSYSKKSQASKDAGPLPNGNYGVRPKDVIEYRHTKGTYVKAALYTLYGEGLPSDYLNKIEKAWGKMPGATGRIVPILNTNGSSEYAFGRNRCWIHGSDFPGSIGCIDLTSHMDAFLQVLGNTVPDRNGMIPLKVSYGVAPTGKEPNEIDMKGHDISRTA
jgi:hypothetical protein